MITKKKIDSIYSLLKDNTITPEEFVVVLWVLSKSSSTNEFDTEINDVLDTVANYYEIPVEKIVSRERENNAVLPRQVSMYLMEKLTNISLENIGKVCGDRDHSTVIHGINRIKDKIDTDTSLKNDIDQITAKINRLRENKVA